MRNYVAAWMDYRNEKVIVFERDEEGTLFKKSYNPPYYFYVPDENGTEITLFNDKVIKVEFDSKDQWEYAKDQFSKKFESDITPVKRILMDLYYDKPSPPVKYCLFDLEVDAKDEKGFPYPIESYAPITANSIYKSWTGEFNTYIVPPRNWTGSLDDIYDKINSLKKEGLIQENCKPNIRLCKNESELLHYTLYDFEEADIISGWNTEFFDNPYLCERLLKLGGQRLLARLDLLGAPTPRKEVKNNFGKDELVYRFSGKAFLDYLRLFEKFDVTNRPSYSLENILSEEVGLGKLPKPVKSFEKFYTDYFEDWVAYGIRDVDGLIQLDKKHKFIALANQMAHECTVLFPAVLGTVAITETAVTNHAHNKLNRIGIDKKVSDTKKVEGAIVLTPRVGLHEWLGMVDIKSLYPNTIRSLNISPEKIVGQFTTYEDAWLNIFKESDKELTLRLEDGIETTHTAKEWKQVLLQNKFAISGYGTVFDQGNGNGVISDLLGYWYNERIRLQAEKEKWIDIRDKCDKNTPEYVDADRQVEHFDLLQYTKKISMNATYGALLNPHFTYGDERMGASVTGSGRCITTHMIETIEYTATGIFKKCAIVAGSNKKDKYGRVRETVHYIITREQIERLRIEKKLKNPKYQLPDDFVDFTSGIYCDTDSFFFLTGQTNKEDAITVADELGNITNESFPQFMRDAFLCQPEYDKYIKASREIVGERGIFLSKKKYIIKVVDQDGRSVNKLKIQGVEIKKADTPKIIQTFMKTTVQMILDGDKYDTVADYVIQQRKDIMGKDINMFLLGVAKQANNVESFVSEYENPGQIQENGRKLTVPGHVRAALNYNTLLDTFDKGAKRIGSGDKVLVFNLKPNEYNFSTIAFPSDSNEFPDWFSKTFVVDRKVTETKMFDSKLESIFEAIGKDVPSPKSALINKIITF